jgi:hypothetical protein
MSSVKLMQPADIMGAFGIIAGFFGDSETIRKKSSGRYYQLARFYGGGLSVFI